MQRRAQPTIGAKHGCTSAAFEHNFPRLRTTNAPVPVGEPAAAAYLTQCVKTMPKTVLLDSTPKVDDNLVMVRVVRVRPLAREMGQPVRRLRRVDAGQGVGIVPPLPTDTVRKSRRA